MLDTLYKFVCSPEAVVWSVVLALSAMGGYLFFMRTAYFYMHRTWSSSAIKELPESVRVLVQTLDDVISEMPVNTMTTHRRCQMYLCAIIGVMDEKDCERTAHLKALRAICKPGEICVQVPVLNLRNLIRTGVYKEVAFLRDSSKVRCPTTFVNEGWSEEIPPPRAVILSR